MTAVTDVTFETLKMLRAENPQAIRETLAARQRRDLLRGDGRLLIIAADHPARGALGVGPNPVAMGSRRELLERLRVALSRPGVDGVLGTPDIIEDLAIMGLLDDKIAVGSMNRGGLKSSVFEYDDRFTGYTFERMHKDGLDFAKTLLRINLDDPATADTLEKTAHVIDEANDWGIPIMVEPFMSSWQNNRATNHLTTDDILLSVSIAQGLGSTSALTWLKLPIAPDMAKVMEGTTLPTLLLGGEVEDDQERAFDSWNEALDLPGVRGLVVGRSLLYPAKGDVADAVDQASKMVHGTLEK